VAVVVSAHLPPGLCAPCRATLEEVLAADRILHVGDIWHPETEEQAADVRAIMSSLGVPEDRPTIEVWNKLDLLGADEAAAAEARADRSEHVLTLSALTGQGIDPLLSHIAEALQGTLTEEKVRLGFAEGKRRAWLFAEGVVEDEAQNEDGFVLRVRWTAKQKGAFGAL